MGFSYEGLHGTNERIEVAEHPGDPGRVPLAIMRLLGLDAVRVLSPPLHAFFGIPRMTRCTVPGGQVHPVACRQT
jgi:hypothetical protein